MKERKRQKWSPKNNGHYGYNNKVKMATLTEILNGTIQNHDSKLDSCVKKDDGEYVWWDELNSDQVVYTHPKLSLKAHVYHEIRLRDI